MTKFGNISSGAIWWPNLQPIQVVPLKSILNYSSWKINSRYGVNTLGPLCLWQCFLVRSYLLITLIKCFKGEKSLGSLCSVVNSLIVNIFDNCVISCFFITLIKCLKGHKSQGSLWCSKIKSVTHWVSDKVTHLLSCSGKIPDNHQTPSVDRPWPMQI